MSVILPLLFLAVSCQEFHPHPYEGQYLKEISPPEPTKQGPVLFPNDAPPPPKPPLIVTARPLAEAIARSDLTPTNATQPNAISEKSVENRIHKQGFSNRADYISGFVNAVNQPGSDYDYGYDFNDFQHPYEGVLKKSRLENQVDNRYDDYEEQTLLPPIYKALAEHAQKNVLKIQQKKKQTKIYKVKEPDYADSYPNNNLDKDRDDGLSDDAQDSNYAFSYTVRDKQTGDDFSHSQKSSGSATNGEYRVRLPDGRMQIVSYTADENGYKADVRYDDEPSFNRIDDRRVNEPRISEYNQRTTEDKITKYNGISEHYPKSSGIQKAYQYNHRIVENDPRFAYGPQIHEPVSRVREYGSRIIEHRPEQYSPKISDHGPLAEYKARISDQNQRIAEYNQRINNERIGINNADQNEIRNQDYNENYKANDYRTNEDYSYDALKDYGDDYSSEFDGKQFEYQPHQSKFNHYAQNSEQNKNIGVIAVPNTDRSTVRPSLQSLRTLFLNKLPFNSKIPVQLNVPSTTQGPIPYDSDENVVVIGTPKPNLYTNTKNSVLSTTQSPLLNYQTPSSYLESTIASLRNRNVDFSGPKPVLSGSFIDRINKYLTF